MSSITWTAERNETTFKCLSALEPELDLNIVFSDAKHQEEQPGAFQKNVWPSVQNLLQKKIDLVDVFHVFNSSITGHSEQT